MILDKIIDGINLLKNKNLFESDELFILDNNLNENSQTIQLAISAPLTSSHPFSEDEYMGIFINQIKSEITKCVYEKIHKYILDNSNVSFIDLLSGTDVNTYGSLVSAFQNGIYDIEYSSGKLSNIVGSGRIVSEYITDSSLFTSGSIGNLSLSGNLSPYYVGELGNIKIYTDPFLSWKTEYITSFSQINYKIDNLKTRIVNEATFQPKLVIEFTLNFIAFDPLVIYVIDNITSDAYNKYKSERRNKNIDNILGE